MAARYRLQSELIARARAATEKENGGNVSDDELKAELNTAARLLLDMHLEHDGTEAYRVQTIIPFVLNQSVYPLPSECLDVLGVYAGTLVPVGVGRPTVSLARPYVRLSKFEEHNRVDLMNAEYGGASSIAYRLGGVEPGLAINDDVDAIEVLPAPTKADAGLLVVYVPQASLGLFSVSFGVTDVRIFAPGGSSDWLVARLAAYIRDKEGKDTSFWLGRMAEVEERIKVRASRRDTGEPNRMEPRRRRLRDTDPTRDPGEW